MVRLAKVEARENPQPPPLKAEAQNELERFYGKGAQPNSVRGAFANLLMWWSNFAATHDIRYALASGSALGQLRHPNLCFTPYDQDLDTRIGWDGNEKLMQFADSPSMPNVRYTSQGLDKSLDDYQIVVYPYNDRPINDEDRPRWDCDGQPVDKYEGTCSFNYVLARAVSPFGVAGHLDLFLYFENRGSCETPDGAVHCGRCDSSLGVTSLECVAAPTTIGHQYTTLPPTQDCACGDVTTKCLSNASLVNQHLTSRYGPDYMRPSLSWDVNNKSCTRDCWLKA